jgi:glycosyltransferase involved in cell wall biosynthesis
MLIAMVSEHASPLAALGGVDAGGQNVHVAALAEELAALGHEVTVYTRRDSTSLPERVHARGYTVEHVDAGPPTEVPKDELLGHMREFAADLVDRLARRPADVVHSHFWMSGLATRWALEDGAAGSPVHLHTYHALGVVKRRHQGAEDTSPAERIAHERWLAAEVDHVVATSRDEVEELTAEGLDPDRCSVVPCGVDTRLFRPLRSARDGSSYQVLSLGRLVPRKGLADLVTAMGEVPGAELVVAGGPPADALDLDDEVQRLRALAESAGCADRVRFLGRVDHEDIPALMAGADVVASVPWYEPFGIVPVEAMACGRPVVATAVGGQLDTVVHEETGLLVEPRHPEQVAAAIRRLLGDELLRRRYGENAARRAESYDWREIARRTERVYDEVLQRSGDRPAGREVLR